MSDEKNQEKEKGIVFIEGRKTNLRPLSQKDVPALTRWINDPKVREFVSAVLPQTIQQEADWVNKLGSTDKNIVLCIEIKDGTPIGTMGIHRIDWVHRHCTTGAVIGEKQYWSQGYGRDAKMHLLNYIFNTLNLYRVESNVIEFNERSLKYSLHCGYKIEGRKRNHIFRNGKYWDLIQLGLLREEWEEAWQEFQHEQC